MRRAVALTSLASLVSLVSLAACTKPTQVITTPPAPVPEPPAPPSDVPGPSQEEKLAEIQKAMNELDEAVQACWAVAATEHYEIAGDLVARIAIEATGATATLVSDSVRSPRLAACVVEVLGHYRWAPPLRGETIQLPFRFRAPDDGQNVIDRQLVSAAGQGDVRVSVLLDENNAGNPRASMFELAIADHGSTGMRRADRAELWYFRASADVHGPMKPMRVDAGDMLYVPKGGVREVLATRGAVTAMIAIVPGGPEGTARAGALPTPLQTEWKEAPPAPILLRASAARSYPRGAGKVTIFAEGDATKTPGLAASILEFPAGMVVPEHVHDQETELLYVERGAGTLTVKTVDLAVTSTSVVQVPPATKHAFTTTADLRAIQIYTPAGPEQRFKGK
ncbi:MAG: cupin domain-containing protein [Proteobacteria bacterium]|nr:cupin domain-containing protein [Pseudomonadota bacterium]